MVSFALEVADREGLEAVSFRRLAEQFGVTPMALYHHVKDKAHLLGEMSELFLSEVEVPPRSRDWSGELRRLLLSYLAACAAHPCGPELAQIAPYDAPHARRLGAAMLDILSRAGFSPPEAGRILQQLTALLTSRLRAASPEAQRPRYGSTVEDLGVELLVLGVQALARRKKTKPAVSSPRRPRR
jgi:TetR/AcrR family tetracycline transcriptional repressor